YSIGVGEIVVYRERSDTQAIATAHRVIKRSAGGEAYLLTCGDAQELSQGIHRVERDQVYGRVTRVQHPSRRRHLPWPLEARLALSGIYFRRAIGWIRRRGLLEGQR